ncbi:ATP-binding protein [Planomonospora algeriensis]
MREIPDQPGEVERLAELESLGALDVLVEPIFQAIAELASHVCQTPIALVNLLGTGRQYFKGRVGTTSADMDRRVGFCPYTIAACQLLEVPDAQSDVRFRDDPAVVGEPYVRFYAGAPMISDRDVALGVVCVFDHRPRRLTAEHRRALETLAACAVGMLELHHHAGQTEEVAIRLNRLEGMKQQFLRNINHELRTPLTSIRSYLELLRAGGLEQATQERFLQVIERSGDRMLHLIDTLLLMASLSACSAPFSPGRVDLAGLARQAVGQIAPAARLKDQRVNLSAPQRMDAWADAEQLQIALMQVLDNAVKFTPLGGAIEVSVLDAPVPRIEIHDTGAGIGAEDLPHVFEGFYRGTQAERQAAAGTGVGLSIVEKIMEMHGGSVRMESRLHHGACIHLILPVSSEPPAAEPSLRGPPGGR